MHQNAPFWAQKSKNFLGRGHSLPTPIPPHPYPPRRLDPRAYGARHSPISNRNRRHWRSRYCNTCHQASCSSQKLKASPGTAWTLLMENFRSRKWKYISGLPFFLLLSFLFPSLISISCEIITQTRPLIQLWQMRSALSCFSNEGDLRHSPSSMSSFG